MCVKNIFLKRSSLIKELVRQNIYSLEPIAFFLDLPLTEKFIKKTQCQIALKEFSSLPATITT